MYKSMVIALCGCLLSIDSYAQLSALDSILQQVENNNLDLRALSEYQQNQRLEFKSVNNLPDPQLGGYFLPFGEHSSGNYTEFQISQSFEFPSIYGARNKLVKLQTDRIDLDYQLKRQEILVEAKDICLNMIYLQKRRKLETQRVLQAEKVHDQIEELFDKNQVGILELNKAKVDWMQEQFRVRQIDTEIKSSLLELKSLNGGHDLEFSGMEYEKPLFLAPEDSIWQERLTQDPELIRLRQQEQIAEQSLNLANQQSLPDLTAGYNTQGVAGARFSGIYAGVSIPLWSNRHKIKAARSYRDFQQTRTSVKILESYTAFEKQFNEYEVMLLKYTEYEVTLTGLNSEALLLKAYELGEMSFLEYYMELQFYREAFDSMLEMEYQLYKSQNHLLKHQL